MPIQDKSKKLKPFITALLAVYFGVTTGVLSVLYIGENESGVLASYGVLITAIVVGVVSILTALTVTFIFLNKELLYKSGMLCLCVLFFCAVLLYILFKTGFLDKVDSVEDLREYIASYGGLSIVIFLVVQILQVTIVPIPGVITIGAGVLLFGPFLGAVLSYIGIMLGSVIAFCIGRRLGYKVACWLVGKESLDKGFQLVRGKDKVVLTFMFLFPFFPDDVLCFVSGLSTMSTKFFVVMITFARLVSTFTTAYSVNGSLIPYDTWWGLLIWVILVLVTLWLVKIVYTNSEKIEKFFKRQKK